MKTIYINLLLFISVLFASCSDGKIVKTYKITNFDDEITDTLFPKSKENYTTKYIKLKGNVNDTLYISIDNGYKKYFTGNIDTTFSADYYGKYPVLYNFNTYRASKGELELEFCIQ
ncbi:hypothetical protein E0W68_09900 [Flavobacterium salilacus subsp. salilacus]|uniref:hypothetical protein n=1 Tax=Flavobacterium TaxID=237 RepID=UPI001074F582|nr:MULTISPECIES: hypothetical protein [Flavobacterium]KAF2518324.1 hypothetical protein E0W68_09900 [Flavobacterium salilacus subsp. salilacus]MBE1615261.1 hypothetical protein [Flavobacterium sp. SaA2.13]